MAIGVARSCLGPRLPLRSVLLISRAFRCVSGLPVTFRSSNINLPQTDERRDWLARGPSSAAGWISSGTEDVGGGRLLPPRLTVLTRVYGFLGCWMVFSFAVNAMLSS